jgi:oligopeptide/dipeptide ABC transporter ATP-binding protein
MSKELEVRNLQISFRTNTGTVKAVRDISFDLEKGETLCIVGESGSGKSVTAKAVMGILAGNSIVEGGEIIYNGDDLLKYTEKDFEKIRGNRITMIFQDPLSSLDPIVKIGKQMTEATLLNSKTNCKSAKKERKALIKNIKKQLGANQSAAAAFEQYTQICEKAADAALAYGTAREYTESALVSVGQMLVEIHSKEISGLQEMAKELAYKLTKIRDVSWIPPQDEKWNELLGSLNKELESCSGANKEQLGKILAQTEEAFTDILHSAQPDFLCVGYPDENFYPELVAALEQTGSESGKAVLTEVYEQTYRMKNRITKQMAYDKAIRIMEDVGIKEPRKRFKQYPFEFSGGMRQRIVIAIAIAANPDLLICDEPTTALDVTIQAQIMELINDIKRKRRLSVIFITHDLGVVANMADKVAVMYAGKIVEYGTADDIFYEPAHPYTWALLASMPDLDTKDKLEAIPGTPPDMHFPPVGDAFAERNQYAMQIDFEKQPPLFKISDTHYAATWLLHPDAPKVEPPKSVTDRIRRMKELEAATNE